MSETTERLDVIEARAKRTAAYPFADKLSREDVPYLLTLARKQAAALARVESECRYLDTLADGDKYYAKVIRAAVAGDGR